MLIFPTDDKDIRESFFVEPSEITNDGIMQEYLLGEELKELYGHFIGKYYQPSELRVITGVDNRTIVSALAVLASLLRPVGRQIWNENLPWQPIAIHTNEILDQVAFQFYNFSNEFCSPPSSFGVFDSCPNLREKLKQSEGYTTLLQRDANFKQWLSNMTGLTLSDLFFYQTVLDELIIRHNLKGLFLPEWANGDHYSEIFSKKKLRLHVDFIKLFIDDAGALLLDLFSSSIDDIIHNRTSNKSFLYSGHDSNLITFGMYLNLIQFTELPPYASYMAIEHHLAEGEDIIKGAKDVIIILLIILNVVLMFICSAFKRRINMVTDPEQSHLLRATSRRQK
ncbi:unnamed protein product [Dracunculus medinensis]|uniref:Testicular acid phosphatase homolog n=1 Tax=Dracunculus medinensis TaxID=318479 RepID=A0A0N4U6A1_DRAME|nr:unnamed protein product [Dracunculus medinensis]